MKWMDADRRPRPRQPRVRRRREARLPDAQRRQARPRPARRRLEGRQAERAPPGFRTGSICRCSAPGGSTSTRSALRRPRMAPAYLKLSASYQVGGAREQTGRPDSQQHPPGNGIWLRGLRIRVQDPDDVDRAADRDRRHRHLDQGLRRLDRRGRRLAARRGRRRQPRRASSASASGSSSRPARRSSSSAGRSSRGRSRAADRTIEYLLAGVTLGPIPLGSFTALRGSILVARNFVPKLPAPSGVEQNLRLFNWYRAPARGARAAAEPRARRLGAEP